MMKLVIMAVCGSRHAGYLSACNLHDLSFLFPLTKPELARTDPHTPSPANKIESLHQISLWQLLNRLSALKGAVVRNRLSYSQSLIRFPPSICDLTTASITQRHIKRNELKQCLVFYPWHLCKNLPSMLLFITCTVSTVVRNPLWRALTQLKCLWANHFSLTELCTRL